MIEEAILGRMSYSKIFSITLGSTPRARLWINLLHLQRIEGVDKGG